MSRDFTPEVIVAGAGPVGLVAALSLALAGAKVLLLEKRDALNAASLASTIHPPTLEILDRLGALQPVLGLGQRVETIQYRTPDSIFAEFHMRDLVQDTDYPYRLHLEQALITPVMLERLRSLANARVAFGCGVTGVAQHGDSVTVTLADGTDVSAPHLIAADGSRSAIREALGIGFDGVEYPDKILRLLTTDDLDALLPGIAPLTYLYNGARSISFLRMADCWRIILRVPKEVTESEAMDDGWILSRFRAVLPGLARLPEVAGMDVYGASRRVASGFQRGRVVLVGDAAHVTSTRGGMNMNCGIYDAAAIAAALPSGPVALAAAVAERERVAHDMLIPRTDRSVSGGAAWADALRETARSPERSVAYLRTAAMLDMAPRALAHV